MCPVNQFTLEAAGMLASIDSEEAKEAVWGGPAFVVSRAGGEGLLDE